MKWVLTRNALDEWTSAVASWALADRLVVLRVAERSLSARIRFRARIHAAFVPASAVERTVRFVVAFGGHNRNGVFRNRNAFDERIAGVVGRAGAEASVALRHALGIHAATVNAAGERTHSSHALVRVGALVV